MAYSTLTALQALVPEETLIKLSNDQGGATAVNMTVISAAIAQADSLINRYAGLQREVPLDPVTDSIRDLSSTLAIYNLYRRRNQIPEAWKEQYKLDVAALEKIGAGDEAFGSDGKPATPPAQTLAHSSKKTLGGSGGLLEGY